jgi:hypothetical protein
MSVLRHAPHLGSDVDNAPRITCSVELMAQAKGRGAAVLA